MQKANLPLLFKFTHETSIVANGHNTFKAMVIVGNETNACVTGKTQTFVCKMTTVCRSQKSTRT